MATMPFSAAPSMNQRQSSVEIIAQRRRARRDRTCSVKRFGERAEMRGSV